MKIAPLTARFEKCISSRPWAARLYAMPYRKVVEREIKLAGITGKDRILNIGCGAIPFTAIFLAKKTGAPVHAVDTDQEAVELARNCIRSFGLSGQITVEHASGDQGRFPSFSVAVTALQARPKEAILYNLLNQSELSVRLVFRKPKEQLHHHYDPVPASFAETHAVLQHMRTFTSSVLFTGAHCRKQLETEAAG